MSSSKSTFYLLLLLLALIVTVASRLQSELIPPEMFKSRQGPPEEFHLHKLPNPKAITQSSDSAMISITLESASNGNYEWEGQFPFDSKQVVISLLSTVAKDMELVVEGQESSQVVEQWIGYNENHGLPAKSYQFDDLKTGMRRLTIKCPSGPLQGWQNGQPHLKLLVFYQSPLRVYSHLTTHELQLNKEIGVEAMLGESRTDRSGLASFIPKPIRFADLPANPRNMLEVDMDVILPDGQEQVIHMHDNGSGNDVNANDGLYSATLKATEVGDYVVQVVLRATIDMSKPNATQQQEPLYLFRTSQHLVTVVEDSMDLLPKASVNVDANDEMISFTLYANGQNVEGKKFYAYAEVHGTSSDNKLIPVAWMSGMTIAKQEKDYVAMNLKLSAKWLSKASATFPLKLKNAYIMEVDSFVPLTSLKEIDVVHSSNEAKRLLAVHSVHNFDGTVTETMKMGKRPQLLQQPKNTGHKVLLIHGYCSNNNPFTTSDFTNFVEFLDAKQSRSNDEFAQLIAKLASNYDSVSLVAHSQGGTASLHLLDNYWSHADNAQSTSDYRVIQTVGTPYLGSGLAGTLASIGSVFGIGCGKNNDLTHNGAERWLATISADARKNVYYYTSQYKPYSYCNLAANAVLAWPNDGTTELDYAKLEGGNKVNHLEGYCHTEGMKYGPQCQNHDQNREINSFAHP